MTELKLERRGKNRHPETGLGKSCTGEEERKVHGYLTSQRRVLESWHLTTRNPNRVGESYLVNFIARKPREVPIFGVVTATAILHMPELIPLTKPRTTLHTDFEFARTSRETVDFLNKLSPALIAIWRAVSDRNTK